MMNYWIDIACIVFVCVTANHLGLVRAIEEVAQRELRIVNCPKCFTYWSVLAYTVITSRNAITSLAISFLCSYIAIWLELFEGFIDTFYTKLYETLYPDTENDTSASGAVDDYTSGSVS